MESAETGKRTCWAVSNGEYSDYHVQAIFEREEDAEAWIDANGSREGAPYWGHFVEEFDYWPAGSRS